MSVCVLLFCVYLAIGGQLARSVLLRFLCFCLFCVIRRRRIRIHRIGWLSGAISIGIVLLIIASRTIGWRRMCIRSFVIPIRFANICGRRIAAARCDRWADSGRGTIEFSCALIEGRTIADAAGNISVVGEASSAICITLSARLAIGDPVRCAGETRWLGRSRSRGIGCRESWAWIVVRKTWSAIAIPIEVATATVAIAVTIITTTIEVIATSISTIVATGTTVSAAIVVTVTSTTLDQIE